MNSKPLPQSLWASFSIVILTSARNEPAHYGSQGSRLVPTGHAETREADSSRCSATSRSSSSLALAVRKAAALTSELLVLPFSVASPPRLAFDVIAKVESPFASMKSVPTFILLNEETSPF